MKKKIKKIIVNEKCDGDFRSHVIGVDEYGKRWEIRGYGNTREAAEADGVSRFNGDTEDFHAYGYEF